MYFLVFHSTLFEIRVREVQQHVFRQQRVGRSLEHRRSFVTEILRRVYVALLRQYFRTQLQKVCGLMPDSRMMSQTQ